MFAKLFQQVTSSSLTQHQPIEVRGVFFMLIAMADRRGYILGDDDAIARIINVPIAVFSEALAALLSPDPKSQSKLHDGRRVLRLDPGPGLFLVNYEKYSGIQSDEQRREYFRIKQQEHRAKKKGKALPPTSAEPPDPNPVKKEQTQPVTHYHTHARSALYHLNEASGRSFRETDSNLAIISARLIEKGVDIDGVKQMVERQCQMWKGTRMAEYLRPETLFNKTKFDGYYAARQQPIHTEQGNGFKPLELKSILAAKEKKAEELKNKHCSPTASGDLWDSTERKNEWRSLRKEIHSLNDRLSSMA